MCRNEYRGLCLAVTGGIACGKSELGNWLRLQGFEVVDADHLAHAAIQPGGEAYAGVVEHFGEDMLTDKGTIDRAKLGAYVFNCPDELEMLNTLIHPHVLQRCRTLRATARDMNRPFAALIPLLFEVGETRGWDAILCVSAPEHIILQRLLDRGLSLSEAQKRLDAQWPLEQKAERSDFVLINDGSLKDLHKKAGQLLARIQKKEP